MANTELNETVLISIAAAAQAGKVAQLAEMGIDSETAKMIGQLSLDSILRGRDYPAPLLSIRFNKKAVRLYVNFITAESEKDQRVDEIIKRGIRHPQIALVTGMSRREYDSRRGLLGLEKHATGRLDSPTEEQEIRIYECWKALPDSRKTSLMQAVVTIAQETGYGADTIWIALVDVAGIEPS